MSPTHRIQLGKYSSVKTEDTNQVRHLYTSFIWLVLLNVKNNL